MAYGVLNMELEAIKERCIYSFHYNEPFGVYFPLPVCTIHSTIRLLFLAMNKTKLLSYGISPQWSGKKKLAKQGEGTRKG